MPLPDPEQLAFIERQPPTLTFSELAALCRQRFGASRAWGAETIRRQWHTAFPNGRHARSGRLSRDHDLCDFIRDRAGRVTLDELLETIARNFVAVRVPSRSALHRFIQRDRLAIVARQRRADGTA